MPHPQPKVDGFVTFPSTESIRKLNVQQKEEMREDARAAYYEGLCELHESRRVVDATQPICFERLGEAIDKIAKQSDQWYKEERILFVLLIILSVLAVLR